MFYKGFGQQDKTEMREEKVIDNANFNVREPTAQK